jgi:hypothetical protein
VQQWPKNISGTHCYSTMTSDDSATMTCVMWHEKHLFNVRVLKRVQLSNLVILTSHVLPVAQVVCSYQFFGITSLKLTSILSNSNFLPNTLFSNTLNVCSPLKVHTYMKQHVKLSSYKLKKAIFIFVGKPL